MNQNEQMRELIAAALNMVDVKGRHHSEIAMNRLIEAAKQYRAAEPAAAPEEFNAQSFASLWSSYCDKKIEVADLKEVNQQLLEALKNHQEQTRPIQQTIDALDAAKELGL